MKTVQRIGQLFSAPAYRTKIAFFVLVGTTTILLAILVPDVFWRDILLQFSVTFIAVALIQISWDFLGGDPMETHLGNIQNEIALNRLSAQTELSNVAQSLEVQFDSLRHSMHLLADLIDGNIGIVRIWPDRKTWQKDPEAGLLAWYDWVCRADEISIVSNTMWHNWLHDDRFRKQLFANLARGATVRLLMYDPDSDVLRLRAEDETHARSFGITRMRSEIDSSLSVLAKELETLEDVVRQRLQIRLTWKSLHFAQLIHADDQMLVALYLTGKTGGPSPTFQLQGPQSTYFSTYAEQFEILWERARPLNFTDLQKYVKEFEGAPQPPVER